MTNSGKKTTPGPGKVIKSAIAGGAAKGPKGAIAGAAKEASPNAIEGVKAAAASARAGRAERGADRQEEVVRRKKANPDRDVRDIRKEVREDEWLEAHENKRNRATADKIRETR